MFLPLIPLRLHEAGIAAGLIGLNAAASTLAIFVVAPTIARILNRIGYSGAVGGGTILFALTLAGMMLCEGYGVWTALRFLAGLGLTLQWVACESWLVPQFRPRFDISDFAAEELHNPARRCCHPRSKKQTPPMSSLAPRGRFSAVRNSIHWRALVPGFLYQHSVTASAPATTPCGF